MKHVAFSDDSQHEKGRFWGLGLVSLKEENYKKLIPKIQTTFAESGVEKEFKWEKVKNAKYKLCAEKIHDFVLSNSENLRVDVLIWDMQDERHKNVRGRSDTENLNRMYYHLLSDVLSKRWHEKAVWEWYPDEQSAIDWRELGTCLVTKKYRTFQDMFGITDSEFKRLNIESINPTESHAHPFLQIADYFTGLGVYSYGHFERYEKWLLAKSGQQSLFGQLEPVTFSNSEQMRFPLLDSFTEKCKNGSLQISLVRTKGLYTWNQDTNINFWLYKPQHENDKAPQKVNSF